MADHSGRFFIQNTPRYPVMVPGRHSQNGFRDAALPSKLEIAKSSILVCVVSQRFYTLFLYSHLVLRESWMKKGMWDRSMEN